MAVRRRGSYVRSEDVGKILRGGDGEQREDEEQVDETHGKDWRDMAV